MTAPSTSSVGQAGAGDDLLLINSGCHLQEKLTEQKTGPGTIVVCSLWKKQTALSGLYHRRWWSSSGRSCEMWVIQFSFRHDRVEYIWNVWGMYYAECFCRLRVLTGNFARFHQEADVRTVGLWYIFLHRNVPLPVTDWLTHSLTHSKSWARAMLHVRWYVVRSTYCTFSHIDLAITWP